MSMLNLDELNSKINNKNKIKTEIYEKILKNCHSRIKLSAETNNQGFCFYTMLDICMVYLLYNYEECTKYIIDMLNKNGFDLRYTHPNLLYIYGQAKVIQKTINQMKKKKYRN